MQGNNAPKVWWHAWKRDDGPIKVRRYLWVKMPGQSAFHQTNYFIDTDRYHHDRRFGPNTLCGAGMAVHGGAATLATGKVAELKAIAERRAFAELEG